MPTIKEETLIQNEPTLQELDENETAHY